MNEQNKNLLPPETDKIMDKKSKSSNRSFEDIDDKMKE